MDIHIYLDNETFQIRRKRESSVIYKINVYSFDIQRSIVLEKNTARSVQGLCKRRMNMNPEK